MASIQKESKGSFLDIEKKIHIRFIRIPSLLKIEEINNKIVKTIKDCPGVTTLHLEFCIVDLAVSKAIGRVLESHSSLKKVTWNHIFDYAESSEIPRALNYMCKGIITAYANIVVLDLSRNNINSTGIVGLKKFFESPSCITLEELKLNYNFLGTKGAELLTEYMCKCLEASLKNGKPMKLNVFECCNNQLGDDGATFISKFLDGLSSLKSLDLSCNGIGPTGMKALSNVFYSNPLLKNIILDVNSLSDDGVNHIVCGLRCLLKLQTLSLAHCHLGGLAVRRLASVMGNSCPEVRKIDLSFNEIDSDVDVLLDALEDKPFFEDLNINYNKFNPDTDESLQYRIFCIKRKVEKGDTSSEGSRDASDSEESMSGEEFCWNCNEQDFNCNK